MSSLVVEKSRKKAAIVLSDQSQLTGYIFLGAFTETGSRPQTILELLEAEGRFLPFENSNGDCEFLNQDHIVWLSAALDPEQPKGPIEPEKRTVTVFLAGGKRIRGEMLMELPREKARLSDWLNSTGRFMTLQDGKREVHLNSRYVIKVV
ncbi:MAG: hypothetical protein V1816_26395 [Pseudomonadota bacterium]